MGSKFDDSLVRLKELSEYRFPPRPKQGGFRAKLDANENWHIPAETLRRAMSQAATQVDAREYGTGTTQRLQRAIAEHLHISPESIIPTEGADQGIDLLSRVFLRRGDRALIVGPTYSFYRLRAAIAEAQCIEIEMNKDLSLPVDSILSQSKETSAVFVCSPNNPTGNQFDTKELMRVCDGFSGVVILDEAYVEFAQESLVHETANRENLVILRTFSKAFGLANLRLGFIVANPELAQLLLDRVQYPYPISSLVAEVAIHLLKEFQPVERGIESLREERTLLLEQLRKIKGIKALDSQTNFILLDLPAEVDQVHAQLLERGVAVKKIGRVLDLRNCVRVTVGTKEMNSIFVDSLKDVLNSA
jgi:histidinol-phosphate aminotransferase